MKYLLRDKGAYVRPSSYLKDFGCIQPDRYIEIHMSGDVSTCCFTWLPKFCGNILKDGWEGILRNTDRLDIIADMKEGKFTHCNDHCPILGTILGGNEDFASKYFIIPLIEREAQLAYRPYVIHFSYDTSCNLQCPSCRSGFLFTKLNESKTLSDIHTQVKLLVEHLISKNEKVVLSISGSSDAFASPTFWNYLVELSKSTVSDNLSFDLMTNGLLMTEERWDEIKPLWKNIRRVLISTDAVHQDTYAIVRKNGQISKLKKNLDAFNRKVKAGDFPNLYNWQTNFTVQKQNFKELQEYATWQLQHDTIGSVFFAMIAHWGHLTNEQYSSMMLTDDEEKELTSILSDSVFSDHRIQLGNLTSLKGKNYDTIT